MTVQGLLLGVVRIHLWRKFERTPENLNTLFDLVDRFQQSKEVRSAAAVALIQFPVEEDDDETVRRVRGRLTTLIASLDDVFVLQPISEDDPMATLNALVEI